MREKRKLGFIIGLTAILYIIFTAALVGGYTVAANNKAANIESTMNDSVSIDMTGADLHVGNDVSSVKASDVWDITTGSTDLQDVVFSNEENGLVSGEKSTEKITGTIQSGKEYYLFLKVDLGNEVFRIPGMNSSRQQVINNENGITKWEWVECDLSDTYNDKGHYSGLIWLKATAPVMAPSAVTGLKYTGAEQNGISGADEISNYLAETDGVTGNVKATDQGTYTVVYKLKEGYSWDTNVPTGTVVDGSTATVSWSIGQGDCGLTPPTAKTGLSYNGQAQELVNKGTTQLGTILYKLDDGNYGTELPKATAAGTYRVFYKVEGTDNYTGKEESSLEVTIGKKDTKAGDGKDESGVRKFSDVPEELKQILGIETVEELKKLLLDHVGFTKIWEKTDEAKSDADYIVESGSVLYDIYPVDADGTELDPSNFVGPFKVSLPYPAGTNATYKFKVAHMFAYDHPELGKSAGDVEYPEVTCGDQGISFEIQGFSPVLIAWQKATLKPVVPDDKKDPAGETDTTPAKEDKPKESETRKEPSLKELLAAQYEGHVCKDSDFAWETVDGTETEDGSMTYKCKECGNIKYQVPITAYYTFNKNASGKIRNARAGQTVKISTPVFVSFHEMVRDAIAANPNVEVIVDYKYKGKNYEMTIPAGTTKEQLDTLWNASKFCGFRNMASVFPTKEK